jgi:hypothetical protein
MNIWERYPAKGTHYEAMKAKAGLHTFEYYVYYGRDRDDWRGPHKIKALTKEEAIRSAQDYFANTGWTVWNKTFKVIQNQ